MSLLESNPGWTMSPVSEILSDYITVFQPFVPMNTCILGDLGDLIFRKMSQPLPMYAIQTFGTVKSPILGGNVFEDVGLLQSFIEGIKFKQYM